MKNVFGKGLFVALLAFLVVLGVSLVTTSPAAALPAPVTLMAAADPDQAEICNQGFLGLVPWYNYMQESLDANCQIKDGCFNIFPQTIENKCGQKSSDVPGILLAIIDDLLRIAGLVAIGFVFAGAFKYIESRGNSEKTAQAQSTIINALAGLAVALVSVGFVAFLGHRLG